MVRVQEAGVTQTFYIGEVEENERACDDVFISIADRDS
jgi:hypothetical protein